MTTCDSQSAATDLKARAARWQDRDIVVLLGGTSAEREVSLRTGKAMHAALAELGIAARLVDPGEVGWEALLTPRPDVVLLALHGSPGEDGRVQGMLELLDVPYTGCGVQASAVAMDKVRTKQLASFVGVPTARWTVVERGAPLPEGFPLPAILKPSLEGSSVGVARVLVPEDWEKAMEIASAGAGALLLEEAITGLELTIGVRDREVLGAVEIHASSGFYDYEAKYVRGDTTYLIPPQGVGVEQIAEMERLALQVADVLGCRGVFRIDFLHDPVRGPFLLEVNTIPGMTATSLVPKLAASRGESFPSFVLGLLEQATTDARLLAQQKACGGA